MRFRRPAVVLASLVLGAALTGCSEGELRGEVEGIASAAGESASVAAADAVRAEVCGLVEDRQLSDSDLEVLRGLVDTAQAAGAESEFLTALEDVAGTDGTPPESDVAKLAQACE